MPLGTTAALETLQAILKAVDPSWRSGATRYLSLHTANPGVGGSQTTSEAAYPSYARVAVTSSSGWTDTNPMTNTGLLQFPKATGATTELETYLVIGTASTGAGQILVVGSLTAALQMANNIRPQFDIGAISVAQS